MLAGYTIGTETLYSHACQVASGKACRGSTLEHTSGRLEQRGVCVSCDVRDLV